MPKLTIRNTLVFIAILGLTLISADPVRLVRLTLINKGSLPIAVRLTGTEKENFYYLNVPKGSRSAPQEREFFIVPDQYQVFVYYLETYDPVYGFKCSGIPPSQYGITHNTRIVFLQCGEMPPNRGECRFCKFWPFAWPKFRF